MKFFDSQSEASIQWSLKLTLATKQNTPCERVWKTVPEDGVFSCVPFSLRLLGRLEICALKMKPLKSYMEKGLAGHLDLLALLPPTSFSHEVFDPTVRSDSGV